jgi:hypothetical protein
MAIKQSEPRIRYDLHDPRRQSLNSCKTFLDDIGTSFFCPKSVKPFFFSCGDQLPYRPCLFSPSTGPTEADEENSASSKEVGASSKAIYFLEYSCFAQYLLPKLTYWLTSSKFWKTHGRRGWTPSPQFKSRVLKFGDNPGVPFYLSCQLGIVSWTQIID